MRLRTGVDTKLIERSGLNEFAILRLRRELWRQTGRLTYAERLRLAEGGTVPRLRLLISIMHQVWDERTCALWLNYIDYSEQDIEEMCRGEYPISPYLIRVFSALFGIRVDFLLLGSEPSVDKVGANIDLWPLATSQPARV